MNAPEANGLALTALAGDCFQTATRPLCTAECMSSTKSAYAGRSCRTAGEAVWVS